MRTGVDADTRAAAAWEGIGVVFILGIGAVLHFLFAWSGNSPLVAPFAAINESVWEHLKMAFWPACVWALLERGPLNSRVNNFPLAKTTSVILMPLIIIGLFYGYTGILGENVLFLDITIFVVAVVAGQYVSFRLLTGDERSPALNLIAPIAIIVLAILFIVFTFSPPQATLFQDSITGRFGMP